MTKDESAQLIQDVAFIKQSLTGGDFGPGLIQKVSGADARTYENQRAIAKVNTVVWTIGAAITFIGLVLIVVIRFKTLITALWSPESLVGPMLAIIKNYITL